MNNNKKPFFKSNQAAFALGAALIVALTGYAADANAQGVRVIVTPPVIVVPAPPVVVVAPVPIPPPVVVVPDNYVYYPNYGIYYNSGRHQYGYLKGDSWVWTPAPFGVSADVLLASPSARMDFHDDPSHHHDEMLRRYPRNWAPDVSHDHDHDQDQNHDQNHDRQH
jgi:hypothetical protein